MKRLAIIGAGVLGKQAMEIALVEKKYKIVGFYDDFLKETSFENYPILGTISSIKNDFKVKVFDFLFIAVGYNHLAFKQTLFERFNNLPFANIIHPSSVIEKSAILKGGNLIYADCYIGPHCTLEPGVVMNIKSWLAHESSVGRCTFVSAGVNVGGKTNFGERCFIGIGVTLVDNIEICNDVFIGAGTVVIRSIKEKGKYIGVPSRKIPA